MCPSVDFLPSNRVDPEAGPCSGAVQFLEPTPDVFTGCGYFEGLFLVLITDAQAEGVDQPSIKSEREMAWL
ncbi:hypothetical protein D9M68_188480 [compost metagenome]